MTRKPLALSNWKMAMTVAASQAFARDLAALAGDLLGRVDVVICPPYTALWPVARALGESPIQLGAQNVAAADDPARTGEISAALLADAGCRWVMLGHWEVRRHLGDDDERVNRKLRLALGHGLQPVLAVGEAHDADAPLEALLEAQLARLLAGCRPEQVAAMAFMYEPETAIGGGRPASAEHVARACDVLRAWLGRRFGEAAAGGARIIYGGSVAPEFVPDLLQAAGVDGLGAGRRGRDPAAFAEIVRLIAEARLRLFE
jgi:triosephosphate isomerase